MWCFQATSRTQLSVTHWRTSKPLSFPSYSLQGIIALLIRNCRWFWGFLSVEQARAVLQEHDPETYLVRFSSKSRQYVLSIRTKDGVVHIRLLVEKLEQ